MKASIHNNHKYYKALHDVFTVDYHQINEYILDLYNRPMQFIEETGPPLDRFLREYTLPGAPRPADMPTGAILEFIGQIDEFTGQTVSLFDEHKAHVDECAKYMQKVSVLKNNTKSISQEEVEGLTPQLISVHEGLKRIKEKADYMTGKLEKLESRWAFMKGAING